MAEKKPKVIIVVKETHTEKVVEKPVYIEKKTEKRTTTLPKSQAPLSESAQLAIGIPLLLVLLVVISTVLGSCLYGFGDMEFKREMSKDGPMGFLWRSCCSGMCLVGVVFVVCVGVAGCYKK